MTDADREPLEGHVVIHGVWEGVPDVRILTDDGKVVRVLCGGKNAADVTGSAEWSVATVAGRYLLRLEFTPPLPLGPGDYAAMTDGDVLLASKDETLFVGREHFVAVCKARPWWRALLSLAGRDGHRVQCHLESLWNLGDRDDYDPHRWKPADHVDAGCAALTLALQAVGWSITLTEAFWLPTELAELGVPPAVFLRRYAPLMASVLYPETQP